MDSNSGTHSHENSGRSNWRMNLHTRIGGGLPQVGQAVSGFVPHIIGPSTHHRAILSRLHSQNDNHQGSQDNMDNQNSVVLDLGNANEDGDTGPPIFSQDHFQIPPLLRDETSNTEFNDDHEDHHHGHSHDGATSHFSLHKMLLNSGVFVLILFIRLMSDHVLGLLVFIAMLGTFLYANISLQKAVHESAMRDSAWYKRLMSYLWIIFFMVANIACVFYVFKEQELWNLLMFQLPAKWNATFFDFVWALVVIDFILKFMTVVLKSLISVLPIGQKRRGKFYMFIEHFMQLYRVLVPIIPWYHILSDGQGWIFAGILIFIYFLFKISHVVEKVLDVAKAFSRLRSDISYGVRAHSSDIKSRGESCPICQDDYKDPIMLACKHIFCENCVTMWFDREKTCPMCRAEIHTESPLWKDGSTSFHIQWY